MVGFRWFSGVEIYKFKITVETQFPHSILGHTFLCGLGPAPLKGFEKVVDVRSFDSTVKITDFRALHLNVFS